jgi:hypothetical protein
MKDYLQGKIYTIRCKTNPEYVYVGSTTKTLDERLKKIQCNLKEYKTHKLFKKIIEEFNGKWDEWYIELYENCPSYNKKDLQKEREDIVKLIGTLNFTVMYDTLVKDVEIEYNYYKEWCKQNINKIKDYEKLYRKEKEKVKCECGCELTKEKLKRHQQTKKHINKMLRLTTTSLLFTNLNDIN